LISYCAKYLQLLELRVWSESTCSGARSIIKEKPSAAATGSLVILHQLQWQHWGGCCV